MERGEQKRLSRRQQQQEEDKKSQTMGFKSESYGEIDRKTIVT